MVREEYCEAEAFAQNEIARNARAEKRERKLMDREVHKNKKKSAHSGHSGKKYTGFEFSDEEENLLHQYGF